MYTDIHLYRRLFHYLKPCWKPFMLAVAGMFISALADTATPALMKPLLDDALIAQDRKMFFWVPVLLVVVFFLRGASGFITHVMMELVAQRVIGKLRTDMFDSVLDYSSSHLHGHNSGTIISRFIYDAEQIRFGVTDSLVTFFRDLMTVAGLLLWMTWLNPTLTMICLLATPVVVALLYVLKKRLRALNLKVQESMGAIQHLLTECLKAHPLIKLYAGKRVEMARFGTAIDRYRKAMMLTVTTSSAINPVIQTVTAILLAIIIYISGNMISNGSMTVGDFVSFFAAAVLLLAPVKRLVTMQANFQKALAAAESVFSVMDDGREALGSGHQIDRARGEITFDQVCFNYAPHQGLTAETTAHTNTDPAQQSPPNDGAPHAACLRDINLHLHAGETIALVGASGSGKSTLISLLPRLYDIDSGCIRLDGMDIHDINLRSLRQQFAYVSQEAILFSDTIRNNILYGSDADERKIWEVAEMAHAAEFIRPLPAGMDTLVGESGACLSGGQKQRIAIARALLKDAPILIMDEATSALDTQSELHIRKALDNVCKGRTCIIIAHRRSSIALADRIVVLEHGEIVQTGTHEELIATKGRYLELYRAQT